MAQENRNTLKQYFETGKKPTEQEYANLVDSTVNNDEDKASVAEAQAGNDDVKYITSKTAKRSVETFASGAIPSATISTKGKVELATLTEVQNGTDTERAVTPEGAKRAAETHAPVLSVNSMTGNVVLEQPNEVFAIINSNGSIKAQSGSIQINSQRNSVGNYSILFVTPLSNSDYFISLTNKESIVNRDDIIAKYDNNTTTGFDVWIGEQDNGGTEGVYKDREFMIHVRAL